MARPPPAPKPLPPPTAGQCWGTFLKWVLGVPMVCAGGLVIIYLGLWAAGGQELIWQATRDMGTALFWIAAILLMYPVMIFVWVAELRDGLKAAREWDAMSPEARASSLANAEATALAGLPGRRARKRG